MYYDEGDPESSTVKYENDVAPYKLTTDVVADREGVCAREQPTRRRTVGRRRSATTGRSFA